MQHKDLLNLLEQKLPSSTAMEGDAIGLQIESDKKDLRNFLLTMELNDEVVQEAIDKNCDAVVTFHPLIFRPLKRIEQNERVGRLSYKLIKNSISLFAAHTNFDAYEKGTSKVLADRLNLKSLGFLVPDNLESYGMGVVCEAQENTTVNSLLETVHKVCNSALRYNNIDLDKSIKKVAILGGSGSSFIPEALKSGVDAFITADISYHNFHMVQDDLLLIDPGHYEMEQFVPFAFKEFFIENFNKDDYDNIWITNNVTNPISYYPNPEKYINLQKELFRNTNY